MSNPFGDLIFGPVNLALLIVAMIFTLAMDIAFIIVADPARWDSNSGEGSNGKFLFAVPFFLLWVNAFYLVRIFFRIVYTGGKAAPPAVENLNDNIAMVAAAQDLGF